MNAIIILSIHINADWSENMNKTLELLWNEYFADECARLATDKEREQTKEAAQIHEYINARLTENEKEGFDKYIDALCDIQCSFAKRAFFKGCEFAASFLLEVYAIDKR